MNKSLLVSKMYLHGDTQSILADAIGCTLTRFNQKLNETANAQFTQGEIKAIRDRYRLTAEEVDQIFFTEKVSR